MSYDITDEILQWAKCPHSKFLLKLYGINLKKRKLKKDEFRNLLNLYLKDKSEQKNTPVFGRDFSNRSEILGINDI